MKTSRGKCLHTCENVELRDRIAQLECQLKVHQVNKPVVTEIDREFDHDSDQFHECERLRSIVITGIDESQAPVARHRLQHDFDCVMDVLSYLGIECFPTTLYCMGRPKRGSARLLKVILPSTYHQKLAVRRAPWLRSFSIRGIFLRESLTLAERVRRRELRAARVGMGADNPNGVSSSQSVDVTAWEGVRAPANSTVHPPSNSLN